MTYLASNVHSLRLMWFLMLGIAVGCASKGDSLGGAGGSSQSGGAPGTGGLSQSGGAPGTGGQGVLTSAEAIWAAAKPTCPIYKYQSRVSSVFNSCAISTYEIANDQLIRFSYVSYDSSSCTGNVTSQSDEVGAQLPDAGVARTVEELFSECQTIVNEVAASPSAYEGVSLVFDVHGVPETCLATAIQCIDDCTDGIRIDAFTCEASPSFDAGLNPG